MWHGYSLLKEDQKKYIYHVTHALSSADISIFFIGNQQLLLDQEIYRLRFNP